MLSVLVINKHENRPGKGFFRLYSDLHGMPVKSLDEELVFVTELKKVMKYRKWTELKYYLGI